MKWLFRQKNIVVLDFGSDTIKLAEYSIKNQTPFLEKWDILAFPEGGIEHGDVQDIDLFKEILPDFLKRNIANRKVDFYISISGRSVIVQKMEVLKKASEELRDQFITEEIKQKLPWDIEHINYDYFPMKNDLSISNVERINVLLVAVKKQSINYINQLMKNIEYSCKSIDFGGFALGAGFKFISPELIKDKKNILLLDIGKGGTIFTVINGGDVIFSNYIYAGSHVYTVKIMSEMDWDFTIADTEKKNFFNQIGETPENIKNMIELSNIFIIEKYFQDGYKYFKYQFQNEEISSVYVTGGGAKSTSLIKEIEAKFKIPTKLIKPFDVLKCNSNLQYPKEDIQYFILNTLGICLRGLEK